MSIPAQGVEGAGQSYQERVRQHFLYVAGDDTTDMPERRDRACEEFAELQQALGGTLEGWIAVGRYVWGRPIGEPAQEMGGTLNTLAALAAWADLDMMACAEAELERTKRPEIVAKIRRKRANRHGRGVLPGNDADLVTAALASPRADSDERTAGVLWSAWSEDDCDSDPRIDPMAQKVTEWFVGRWPIGADEPECRIPIGEGRSAEIIARRIADNLTSILNTDVIRARKAATPVQPAGAVPESLRALSEVLASATAERKRTGDLYNAAARRAGRTFEDLTEVYEAFEDAISKLRDAKDALADHCLALLAPHPAGQSEDDTPRCGICDKPLIAGQRVMQDVELGTVHAACCGPEREAYVKDIETGEPLGPNDPIPQGYVYEPEQADGQAVRTILARLWCQAEGNDPDDTISDAGHTVLDGTLGGLDKKAFVAIVEAERAILKATTPPGGSRYQYREIGEGEGWRDCSRESYLAFASDPHIDTREIKAHPAGQSAGSGAETDDLVDRFSAALKVKLRAAEAKYGWKNGWLKSDWQVECQNGLLRHVGKGDPLDVAAYAAFCWHHGWPSASRRSTDLVTGAVIPTAGAIAAYETRYPDGSLSETSDNTIEAWNRVAAAVCLAEKPAPDSTRTGQGEAETDEFDQRVQAALAAWKEAQDTATIDEHQDDTDAGAMMCALAAADALAARPAAPEAQGAWSRLDAARDLIQQVDAILFRPPPPVHRPTEQWCEEYAEWHDAYVVARSRIIEADKAPAPPASSGQEG